MPGTAPDVRHDTLLWPYAQRGNVAAATAAAHAQAEAAVAEDEWVGDVRLGTGNPAKGSEDMIAWKFSYQVAKREPGSSIAARPR